MSNFTTENLIPYTGTIQPGQRLIKRKDGTFLPVGVNGSGGGAEVTLGYITSDGAFQPITFSDTSAYDNGSAVNLSCYNWNLPVSSGSSGGSQTSSESSGGSWTSSGVVINGGTFVVEDGEIWNSTTVNSGGKLEVSSGGTAIRTVVNSVGSIAIYSGGTVNSTWINSGANLGTWGGTINTIVNSGGSMYVTNPGATVSNATLVASGYARIGYQAIATGVVISSGCSASIEAGSISSATVEPDGSLQVDYRGTATDVTVSSGGTMTIQSGAVTSNITSMTGAFIVHL